MSSRLLLEVVFITLVVSCFGLDFSLHRHSLETGSRCLDGSSSALYLYQGTQSDKVLIYFEGGGLCRGMSLSETIEDCYKRSQTNLGSSLKYPQVRNFDKYSVLSSVSSLNPVFYNWSKVFIPYCDGALHQGSRKSPISYKGYSLYFRGTNNTQTHFKYLASTMNLFDAKKVVLTGTSAGAIASVLWSNYLYEKLTYPQGLVVIPDSGLMIFDFVNPWTKTSPALDATNALYKVTNVEVPIPLTECTKDFPGEKECTMLGIAAHYVKPPTFLIQSEYDMWGISNILQPKCADYWHVPTSFATCSDEEMAAIESYRGKTVQGLKNFTKYEKNGVWAVSCAQHGFLQNDKFVDSNNYRVPQQSGITITDALRNFFSGQQPNVHLDEVSWPLNEGCNGKTVLRVINN